MKPLQFKRLFCGFYPSQAVNTFQNEQGQSKNLTGNDGTSQSVNPAWAPDPALKKKPHQAAHKQHVSQTLIVCTVSLQMFCFNVLLHHSDSFIASLVYDPFLHQPREPQSTAQGCLVPPLTTGPAPPPAVTSTSLQQLQTQTYRFKK